MSSTLNIFISTYLVGLVYGYRQNVLDFCSAVMDGDGTDDGGCTCVGRTGKSGPPGPRGIKGDKGDRGDEFNPSEIMRQLDNLKNKVEKMRKIPEIALHYCLMGMKSGAIPDSATSASSEYNASYDPKYARLDMISTVGAWCPRESTLGNWIQVDLGSSHLIDAIVIQGRVNPANRYWVKTYKVACGITENNLSIIREGRDEKIFEGNNDSTTKVIGWFPQPLSCRYVRLYPQTWQAFLCLRMDIVKADCP